MIYYQALWNDVHHFIHGLLKNDSEMDRMSANGDSVAQAVVRVVRQVQSGRLSADEAQWRSRIESLRDSMNGSREVLEIADFGAQSPLKKLSDEEMYAGRIVERTLGEVCRSSSKPPKWSFFLFRLVRELVPQSCLELGTCLGISGAYIAAAMQMNGKGRLITIEGSDVLAEHAKRNFSGLGFSSIDTVTGRFQDALPSVLDRSEGIDIVFIDGHHDGRATIRYFETILPSLRDDAVVIFDDIAWSREMHDAWSSLRAHERVRFSVDMFDMGLCCIGARAEQQYRIAV